MSTPTRPSILSGATWTVGWRWLDRLTGLVSTFVLARLLMPEDFGVVAMAWLTVSLIDVVLDLGVVVALVQNRAATKEDFDRAWTLRLLQSLTTATVAFACAAPVASYYGDVRVADVLRALTLAIVAGGLENTGVVAWQKELRFDREVRFLLVKRLSSVAASIAAALAGFGYWSLVIGTVTGRVAGTTASYAMHGMRPRIRTEKLGGLMRVSVWMVFRSIGVYLNENLHRIIVGRFANAGTLGAYTMASEIAVMPSSELLAPVNRVLFPAFVEVAGDPARVKRLYLLAQGVQTMIAIPASAGLALVAHEAIAVTLGEKWAASAPLLQVLALMYALQAVTASGGYVMMARNRVPSSAIGAWVQVVIFAAAVAVLPGALGALEVAHVRLLAGLLGAAVSVQLVRRALGNVTLAEIAGSISRPILATVGMAAAIVALDAQMAWASPLARLLAKVPLGVLVYGALAWLMWLAAGRPEGAESYLLARARSIVAARRPVAVG